MRPFQAGSCTSLRLAFSISGNQFGCNAGCISALIPSHFLKLRSLVDPAFRHRNAFHVTHTVLHTELEARRNADPFVSRHWLVEVIKKKKTPLLCEA